MERKVYSMENGLVFWGILGEAELFLKISGSKVNILRELRFSQLGIWGDQCIILGIKGPQTPWGGGGGSH